MAPREATGTFPDQFLTFDYDAAVPLGVPPPHDPIPALGGENGVENEEDGNGAAPDALNHVETGTNSASETHRPDTGNASQVDPLSIDPTGDQTSATWPGTSPTPMQVDGELNPPTAVSPLSNGASVAVRRPFSPMTSVGPASSNNIRGNDDQTSSPLSTGTSYLHTTTAPNSPLSIRGSTSPASLSTNSASLGNQHQSHPQQPAGPPQPNRRHGRARSLLSTLDAQSSPVRAVSDLSSAVPNLERTFDSSTTTGSAATAGSDHWVMDASNAMDEDDDGQEEHGQNGPQNLASSNLSTTSSEDSTDTLRMIYRNSAFDDVESSDQAHSAITSTDSADDEEDDDDDDDDDAPNSPPGSPNSIALSFGPNTTVSDLKYFAERGCIVALLQALNTPRLVTLGTRMLADYAKMSHRRVAVASNKRILEFVQRTMLQVSEQADWVGREYAVETVRSLTATEESDRYLMGTYGLLNTLALVARGGPFVTHIQESGVRCTVPLASEKARLHACIAIMNLSCGKANKIEIAKVQDVLEAMRDVMLNSSDEARLKATTCIKNLSNADANDAALLGTPGLVEALGHVAAVTCSTETGATPCTTNACLALMNLSISKANKHRVYRTPGVMDALMTVLGRTTGHASSSEARVKACSALSNLAIGYDNKIPMFNYPGFVEAILGVIQADTGEARTKACSILWSFAAEMKNQVPVVQRGDILPVLVHVADEDGTTEARFKCVAALTLLAESLDNAIPLLEAGALHPLMDILHDAGPDPTQWKGQTASWCVGFLMNIAQSDEAVPALREAGVVELLAPLLTLDHYQSLKAAMAVTFCCRYDEGDECYDLLRKTENVIPKIISLLHNTLSGRGGNGYKYGVFTLRSSVGCIAALASGPDFMKERIATGPVFESLLRVVTDFCVDGGTPGAIVGGGRDDALSATLAVRALQSLTGHLIPIAGSSALPFGQSMEDRLLIAFESFESSSHPEIKDVTRQLATDARIRIEGGRRAGRLLSSACHLVREGDVDDIGDVASMASNCCGFESLPGLGEDFLHALTLPSLNENFIPPIVTSSSVVEDENEEQPVRTFLLADTKTGRRFVVPTDPSGGRSFNDTRVWCYRRGRFCAPGEEPDPDYVWTSEMQQAYEAALAGNSDMNPSPNSTTTAAVVIEGWGG